MRSERHSLCHQVLRECLLDGGTGFSAGRRAVKSIRNFQQAPDADGDTAGSRPNSSA